MYGREDPLFVDRGCVCYDILDEIPVGLAFLTRAGFNFHDLIAPPCTASSKKVQYNLGFLTFENGKHVNHDTK